MISKKLNTASGQSLKRFDYGREWEIQNIAEELCTEGGFFYIYGRYRGALNSDEVVLEREAGRD